jgi:hypothetical protein
LNIRCNRKAYIKIMNLAAFAAGFLFCRRAVPRYQVEKSIRKTRIEERAPMRVYSGSGGIRTHVPLRTTAFRVRLVMTTSIRFHVVNIQFLCGDYVISSQVRYDHFMNPLPYEKDERYNYTREI